MLFSNYFFYSDVSNFGAVLQTLFKNQLPPSNLSSRNQINLCNLKSYSQKELDLNYSYFFFEIFLKYIQQKSNKQLFCFFKKESIQSNILLSDLITYLVDRFKKFQTKIGKGFFLAEFFESLFWLFIIKDAVFFTNWLKKTMERIFFKQHKQFLYFITVCLSRYFSYFEQIFNVKGLLISVKGKISLTGAAKKKKYLFRVGSYSLTKKYLKSSFSSSFVWTPQGVLGIQLFLFFN